MISVVKEETKQLDANRVRVVVEGASFDELFAKPASDLANEAARSAMGGNVGINQATSPYFPTEDGRPVESEADMKTFRQETVMHGGVYPHKPRRDFIFMRSPSW